MFLLSTLPGSPWLTGCSLEWGANSKRISLDADVALINQFGRCLETVLLFSVWSLGRTPCGNSSPKESVSCASAFLSLFCWSRYVLFLLWDLLVIVVVPLSKQLPCQLFKIVLFQAVAYFQRCGLQEKTGAPLPMLPVSVTSDARAVTGYPVTLPDLRRGMPRRWRRSHRHLRLIPSLRASSVSVM